MRSLALTPAQRRRLERLAHKAGRTPEAMLKFVLRDGFEFCELDVRETIEADEDADKNGTIPHSVVMAEARTILVRHAAKRRQKAA